MLTDTQYGYDPVGNRTGMTVTLPSGAQQTTAYHYNALDELVSDSSGTSYTYNGRGDLTAISGGSDSGTFGSGLPGRARHRDGRGGQRVLRL